MSRRRAADFDLHAAITDPGFTPRETDAAAILEILEQGGDRAPGAARALLLLGPAARDAVVVRASTGAPLAPLLLRLLGRLPTSEQARAVLATALERGPVPVRRAAAIALAKSSPLEAGAVLAEALPREKDPAVRRAMVEALGKAGGPAARAAIEGASEASGPASREEARARVMLDREDARAESTALDLGVAPDGPIRVALRCRAGLEATLMDELTVAMSPELRYEGLLGPRVEAMLSQPPATLLAARTWLTFGFPLAQRDATGDPAEAIVAALTAPEARAIFGRWTRGRARFRLSFARGGKRRAVLWRVAAELGRRSPDLVNDPLASPWEARVYEADGKVAIELVPHGFDARFDYRKGDVPAASHPTIAAALVRASKPRADDIVWDPFVGSGTELCERALAGPFAALLGTDLDDEALRVARENLEACGATRFELEQGNATRFVPRGARPTAVITNPPLGRRVHRARDLADLLDEFLRHASEVLAPAGRLAWVSPFADRTRATGEASGLRLTSATRVDLGGFAAELQVFEKR